MITEKQKYSLMRAYSRSHKGHRKQDFYYNKEQTLTQ
jgi:hypothetical protein